MKQFDVFYHDINGYEIVKRGESWPAFFFTWIWALIKKLWVHGLLTFGIFFFLGVVSVNVPDVYALLWIGGLVSAFVFGQQGNGWWRSNLLKSGYRFVTSVEASNKDEVLAKYSEWQKIQEQIIAQNQQKREVGTHSDMKKYFYTDGTTNYFGPFTLEELREKNITRETKVWFQELGDWKPAGTVPELIGIFKLVPPPITKTNSNFNSMQNLNNQKPPKTWLVESILVTLFCCLPFGIAGIVNATKVESRFYAGDIDGANRYSEQAKQWTTVGFWIGLVFGVIYLIAVISGYESGF